ncbi:MAG: type I DNA topoisomerase [Prevotellaceae bacterium]|jgi:DNA topoisomerase-1|nr:type I DNA topoisomerase [Prevotellaceae bacterium]
MRQDNLVIVESPAKAKTIEKFLGDNFLVKSSYGHIRDLAKKDLGVDIEHNYKPEYIISEDKHAVVRELKKLSREAQTVWLASDEDREGEAIAWHLQETLNLDKNKTNRIVFHEITKNAIQNAIKNPRSIDINLVDAQQARRILDRLVGFEVSPILWKKVKPALSAGRVQSVAVRLIVERERDIIGFKPESYYKVSAIFNPDSADDKFTLKSELNVRFKTLQETEAFLNHCKSAQYSISGIEKKPAKKSPSPPFTTSTLQQEASRKFGFSVGQTMTIAQRLYEAGKITYMRTDSTNLSSFAVDAAKNTITSLYGAKYSKVRQYKTKSKGAQEAHEAIRPTEPGNPTISGTAQEKKLYELIWKRTVASQMSDASLERTVVTVSVSGSDHKFQAVGEVLLFDGFLKVYIESNDDETEDSGSENLLPPLKENQKLVYTEIEATERFTQHLPRYTEASLVKKMEELGIGRPSTYAPTISTIIRRGYVTKEDRTGEQREYLKISLQKGVIKKERKQETAGSEKSKLFPSDIGMLVNDFLMENFSNVIDYNFTADVEGQFDEIASGELEWTKMIDTFYKPFHNDVEKSKESSRPPTSGRVLGTDPKTGKQVSVRIARFGPIAQLGVSDNDEAADKPVYTSLKKGQLIESISLEEALKLFDLPRNIGTYEGETLIVAVGRFGPYVRFGKQFVSLGKSDDPYTVTVERAIELIEEKRLKDKEKTIKDFGNIKVLNGRFGPYIFFEGNNYKLPKDADRDSLTKEKCEELIQQQGVKPPKADKSAKAAKSAAGKPAKAATTAKKAVSVKKTKK